MTDATVATLAALVLGWAAVSGALAHRNITGPLVFVAAGYLLANAEWGLLTVDVETATIHGVAEITLALVLFSDATRVDLHELRHDLWLPARLLGIGLPLSVVLGAALATGTLDGIPWGLAAFVGAALAPTDAALSVQVIEDDRIPVRLRRALNVESGLNDGIATPIVTVTLAVAASQLGVVGGSTSFEAADALRELGAGVAVGLVAGTAGAALLSLAARRDWTAPGARRLGTLAVAISAFTATLAIEGNGFIAAFVAGMAFGATLDKDVIDAERASELPELGGEILALVVWFLFGASLLPEALEHAEARTVAYALLSLTVVRMVPVVLSLVRSGLDHPSVLFVAWFGPRGLASVVFALLAVETLGDTSPAADAAVAAVTLTVLLSVVLHGVTAGPGGRRYVQRERDTTQPGPRARPSRFSAGRDHPDARPRRSALRDVDAAPHVPDNRHQPPAGETETMP
ncbi:MAG TPA: sodium:proton antiporter [Acidimicrobiales bacterium]